MNALTALATTTILLSPLNREYLLILGICTLMSAISITSLRVLVTGRL